MLFLLGETTRVKNEPLAEQSCPVCQRSQPFVRSTESAWFTLFMIPVIPMQTTAHFDQCTGCQSAFVPGEYEHPSSQPFVKAVIAYMMAGYGMHSHQDLAVSLCEKITGLPLPETELKSLLREYGSAGADFQEILKEARSSLNIKGKVDILRAAYLVAYASCELEFEDRLRINLMGSAMELSLETVNAVIAELRRDGYLGIRRYLPTTTLS